MLWRHPDFLKLWAAQTISVFGSQFSTLAIPLLAALVLRQLPGRWASSRRWRQHRSCSSA